MTKFDVDNVVSNFHQQVADERAKRPIPQPYSTQVTSEVIVLTGQKAKAFMRNPSPRRYVTRDPDNNAQPVQ